MVESAKCMSINGTTIKTEFNNLFSIFKTRRTVGFFMFAFVAFTIFLAFSPSSNSSSPWFSTSTDSSYRSQFSSLFDYLFSNTSSSPSSSNNTLQQAANPKEDLLSPTNKEIQPFNQSGGELPSSKNTTFQPATTYINNTPSSFSPANPLTTSNSGEKKEEFDTNNNPQVLKVNETTTVTENSLVLGNQSTNSSAKSDSSSEVSSSKKQGKEKKQNNGIENLVESLMNCDLFDGKWVKDNSYPLYKPGSCSFIDHQFSCYANGRRDEDYLKWKWKPKACTLPRLNGEHMLEILRGKRLVFVGDSLNRNMWESLVCILRNAAKNPKNVYQARARHYFRGEPSYSVTFSDYNSTVEFYVSPFLVREWQMPDENGTKKETLRLDLVGRSSDRYKSADILVFNTGHWWTHDKTAKGKEYYQEGDHVFDELDVLDAFRKALTTWAKWVDANVNPLKTMVFFRGYSAVHFSGGQWNSGGACDTETEPIRNETLLRPYLPKMLVLESVLKGMKTHVTYLNITRLTDFRKDAHPSIYRRYRRKPISEKERVETVKYQDCSHWCLPGVPDAWNEILYSELLVKENKMRHHQGKSS